VGVRRRLRDGQTANPRFYKRRRNSGSRRTNASKSESGTKCDMGLHESSIKTVLLETTSDFYIKITGCSI